MYFYVYFMYLCTKLGDYLVGMGGSRNAIVARF